MLNRIYQFAFILTFALISSGTFATTNRPFRLGMMKIAPLVDNVKPLAMADYSGWKLNADVLIGAFNSEWVGGFSFAKNKHLWWVKAETPLASPVTSIGSWVILGFRDGTFMKVEAETGNVIWKTLLDSFSATAATLHGSTLVIFTASQQLYALDFQSGKTVWLYDAGFPNDLSIQGGPSPVINDGIVFIGLASGEIQAVGLNSGKLLWRFDPEFSEARFHDVMGHIEVRNNRILVARYDGVVTAIQYDDVHRTKVWQETVGGVSTTAFRSGRFYLGCSNGDVYALDSETGKKVWRVSTGVTVTSLTVGEATLYASGSNGRINAINLATGGIVWHDDIGGEIVRKPFIFGNGIYFATGLKNIYGYKLR